MLLKSFVSVVTMVVAVTSVSSPSFAQQRGDLTYMCYKKGWNLWNGVEGHYEACQVRVLESAGNSFRVMMNEPCIEGPSEGDEFWVDGSGQFWDSKRSCESMKN